MRTRLEIDESFFLRGAPGRALFYERGWKVSWEPDRNCWSASKGVYG